MFNLSYYILWILVIFLSISVIVIIKRITPGTPSLDMNDAGLDEGLKVPLEVFQSVSNKTVNIISRNKEGIVLLFLSVNCNACSILLKDLNNFAKSHSKLSIVVFMNAENENDIINKVGNMLENIPVVKLTDYYLEQFKVPAYPFSYFLTPSGKIISKGGVPAGRIHLDLLVNIGTNNAKLKKVV